MKPSDHIKPGTVCVCCGDRPATTVTRLVFRDDSMEQDAILWSAATCEQCPQKLADLLDTQSRNS